MPVRAMLGQLMGAAPVNGLGRVAHLRDILTMRFGFQQLGFPEYQDYGLDRRSELSAEQRAAFLGYRRIGRINEEPVFLEINVRGDMDLHQIASGQGIWAAPLQRLVADAAAYQRRRSSLIAAYKG